MKVKRADVERALAAPERDVRLFLFYGPDAAGSAELAARVFAAAGAEAERVSLPAASLKADPGLLCDEAAAFSLFEGKRVIVIDGGGEDLLAAVELLLATPAAGNPVVIVAGALKKGSNLLAAAEASPQAMACASYVPEGREADRLVVEMGRDAGLTVPTDVARRVAEACAGDRALVRHELGKFALFLGAAPETRVALTHDVVDALSAADGEGDVSRIVDAVLDGDLATLDSQIGQLAPGSEIPLVRSLSRRLLLLARHRAEVERGSSVSSVMTTSAKTLYFREKDAVQRQLTQWSAAPIAAALRRLLTAERDLKAPASIGADTVNTALYAVAHNAARQR